MMNRERLLVPVGVAMVIAFFAPWIDLHGLVSASGWDLATADHGTWKQHLLWLYPAGGALLAAVAAGAARAKDARALGVLLGAAVVGLALHDTLSGLRYGALITVGGACGAVASVATKDRAWAIAAGAIVVVGFFLPWVGERGFAASGWDLARLPALPDELGLPSPKWLYLVPVLGVVAALSGLVSGTRVPAALAGLGVLLVLGYVYLRTVNVIVGWGAWLTLGAGLAALVIGLLASVGGGRAAGKPASRAAS